MGYITTKEAAQILSKTDSRIRQLLLKGELVGKKFGSVWMVSKQSVNRYAQVDRKPGPKPTKKKINKS